MHKVFSKNLLICKFDKTSNKNYKLDIYVCVIKKRKKKILYQNKPVCLFTRGPRLKQRFYCLSKVYEKILFLLIKKLTSQLLERKNYLRDCSRKNLIFTADSAQSGVTYYTYRSYVKFCRLQGVFSISISICLSKLQVPKSQPTTLTGKYKLKLFTIKVNDTH